MILVTGASGNVGSEVVSALVAAGAGVRALVRGPRPVGLPPEVETCAGDLNEPASLSAALAGVHGVFLLSGYADMAGVLAAIRQAGAEQIALLSSGAVHDGDRSNAVVRYNADSEQAVRAAGVPWTILRPSGFDSNALQWVPQLQAGNVIREPFADVPIAAIDPCDIGAVAAVALTQSGHESATYRLTGPEPILPADRVRALADVLHRDLRLEPLTTAQARAQMTRDMPAAYVDAFMSFFADGTYDDSVVHPTVEQITGNAPRSFAQWAAAHVDAFR